MILVMQQQQQLLQQPPKPPCLRLGSESQTCAMYGNALSLICFGCYRQNDNNLTLTLLQAPLQLQLCIYLARTACVWNEFMMLPLPTHRADAACLPACPPCCITGVGHVRQADAARRKVHHKSNITVGQPGTINKRSIIGSRCSVDTASGKWSRGCGSRSCSRCRCSRRRCRRCTERERSVDRVHGSAQGCTTGCFAETELAWTRTCSTRPLEEGEGERSLQQRDVRRCR